MQFCLHFLSIFNVYYVLLCVWERITCALRQAPTIPTEADCMCINTIFCLSDDCHLNATIRRWKIDKRRRRMVVVYTILPKEFFFVFVSFALLFFFFFTFFLLLFLRLFSRHIFLLNNHPSKGKLWLRRKRCSSSSTEAVVAATATVLLPMSWLFHFLIWLNLREKPNILMCICVCLCVSVSDHRFVSHGFCLQQYHSNRWSNGRVLRLYIG